MSTKATEYFVYARVIELLIQSGWVVLCACPPGGTDNRFLKCILPRRQLGGSEKGPRDEIDVTAMRGDVIVFIECKARLSESLTSLNRQLESDYQKLKRIKASFSPSELTSLLTRGMGIGLPRSTRFALALAVGEIDTALGDVPIDMNVIVMTVGGVHILAVDPLTESLDIIA